MAGTGSDGLSFQDYTFLLLYKLLSAITGTEVVSPIVLDDKEIVSRGMNDHLTDWIYTFIFHNFIGTLRMRCSANPRFINDFLHFIRTGRL
jgi:hypothetical protein